ncbi:MAG: HEAT repeat domain-containing protein [Planctomycetota bacterium]
MKKNPAWAAALVALALLAGGALFAEEILTNDNVIQLIQSGMSPALVQRKVEESQNDFDVTAEAMVELRKKDVPDSLIDAMLTAAARQADQRRNRINMQIQLLTSEREEARQSAYLRLLRMGRGAQDRMLELLSTSPSGEIRAALAGTLARMGVREAIPILRVLLKDPQSAARCAAADALFALEGNEAAKGALEYVEDPMGEAHARPLEGYIRLLGHARERRAEYVLDEILFDAPIPTVREAAAWALGRLEAADSRRILETALLRDSDPAVRNAAARSLAAIRSADSLPALINALNSGQADRTILYQAIGRYPAKDVIPILITSMRDDAGQEEKDALLGVLRRLTHQDFGWDRAKWIQWWESNEDKIRTGEWNDTVVPETRPGNLQAPLPKNDALKPELDRGPEATP